MKFILLLLTLITMSLSGAKVKVPDFDGWYGRAEFVSSFIKPGDVGVEIGVDHGVFAYHVLIQAEPSKLYLVDPWIFTETDLEWLPDLTVPMMRDELYGDICELFKPYENVEIIRKKSEDAVVNFPDEFFDFVYIDGEHSYDAVKQDLASYFPKVKVGGVMIGNCYGWQGIDYAVQEFLELHRDEVFWLDDPYNGNTASHFLIRRLK